jgi:hypothetical protein
MVKSSQSRSPNDRLIAESKKFYYSGADEYWERTGLFEDARKRENTDRKIRAQMPSGRQARFNVMGTPFAPSAILPLLRAIR